MKAVALVPQAVTQSDLRAFLEEQCERQGISLDFHCITGDCSQFKSLFQNYQNVIAWNCRMTHQWLTKDGKNVLFVENSLLHQGAGIFVDHGGFYSKSNLCREKTWQNLHDVDLDAFTEQHFGWSVGAGGNPEGPILVCLQNALDANLAQEFPLGRSAPDKLKASLELLYEHLPEGVPITLRPSPRFMEWWSEHVSEYPIRKDWEISNDGKFKDVLPKCRALVTVNSTCASEASTLGIPVATLGTGAFTGSGISLECCNHPERLRDILTWQPRLNAGRRYGEAILGRHFLAYRNPTGPPEFDLWLDRASKGLPSQGQRVKSRPQRRTIMSGTTAEQLAAAEAQTKRLETETQQLREKLTALEAPDMDEQDKSLLKLVVDAPDGELMPDLVTKSGLHPKRVQHSWQKLEKLGLAATHSGNFEPFRLKPTPHGVAYAIKENLI